MDYKVTVDFAPVYECITSLNAFIGKQNHTAMDAGTSWVRQVQTQFAPVMLQRMKEVLKLTDNFSLSPTSGAVPESVRRRNFCIGSRSCLRGTYTTLPGGSDRVCLRILPG